MQSLSLCLVLGGSTLGFKRVFLKSFFTTAASGNNADESETKTVKSGVVKPKQ